MTIDERLEFIATLQQTHDDQIGRLIEQGDRSERRIEELTQKMAGLTERMEVLTERTIQAMDAVNRLARIADNHEDRIEGLEGR